MLCNISRHRVVVCANMSFSLHLTDGYIFSTYWCVIFYNCVVIDQGIVRFTYLHLLWCKQWQIVIFNETNTVIFFLGLC